MLFKRHSNPDWRTLDFWVLDLELSGLDPNRDEILSVAMLPIREGSIRWGEHWQTTVRPGNDSVGDQATVRVHELTRHELRTSAGIDEVLPQIFARLQNTPLILHHASLDLSFLKSAAKRFAIPMPDGPVIDTVRLIHRYNDRGQWLGRHGQELSLGLSDARESLGLPPHRVHDPLADALATAELFLCLRARLGYTKLRQLK